MKAIVSAVVLGLMVTPPAAAAEPVVLPPSSKWVLDYADQKCRLLRTFGAGDAPALIALEQSAPKETFGLTLAGPQLKGFSEREVDLTFAEGSDGQKRRPFTGTVEKFGTALIFSSVAFRERDESERDDLAAALAEVDVEAAAAADFIEVRRGSRHIRFDTGNMEKPIAALNRCTADLARSWGLDPDRLRTASRAPTWRNEQAIVRKIVQTYPTEAIRRGERAIMEMRVLLGPDGKVTSCTLENSTKVESLESPACDAMKQAEFDPALDATGTPISSLFATTIIYTMG